MTRGLCRCNHHNPRHDWTGVDYERYATKQYTMNPGLPPNPNHEVHHTTVNKPYCLNLIFVSNPLFFLSV